MMNICIEKLKKAYDGKSVFNGFDICFEQGEITCVMAESGYGKTTLLYCMMGLEFMDEGVISGMPERFSAVFQEDRLCEQLTVYRNIKIVCDKQVPREEIGKHLEQVGLLDAIDSTVNDLSGGMKRRVAVVRAVMAPGDLLLLDEPLKGLDTYTKKLVIDYIKRYQRGRTMIVITHDIQEVELFEAKHLKIIDE